MNKTKVAIVKGPQRPNKSQIEASVRKAIELVGGLDDIKKGDIVLIKPNVCAPAEPDSPKVTNKTVCTAIADMVKEKGGRPIIGEAPGVLDPDSEKCFKATGYDKLRELGYEVMDLKGKDTPMVKVPVPKGKVLKELTLPKILFDAKLVITVPVMKTHGQGATLGLKNMKGVLPDKTKKDFHRVYGVSQAIADLMTVAKPGLSVVDGIVAMEGLGPMLGDRVELGVIIAGKDPVAVDSVTGAVMGFAPEELSITVDANKAGIGVMDLNKIEIIGTPLKDVQRHFKRVEEVVRTVRFPEGFQMLIDEKACTGCREAVLGAIFSLEKAGNLDKLVGWTIVAGTTENAPEAKKDKLLLFGSCTAKYKSLGTYVKGCPPWGWDIPRIVTGVRKTPEWLEKY
ncbi:MAG: DUF362 domain-containing protein [Chloroflexota bacterium]